MAVILAVFLVPWVCGEWQSLHRMKPKIWLGAQHESKYRIADGDLKILKGDAAHYPAEAQRNMIYCVPTCVEMV